MPYQKSVTYVSGIFCYLSLRKGRALVLLVKEYLPIEIFTRGGLIFLVPAPVLGIIPSHDFI